MLRHSHIFGIGTIVVDHVLQLQALPEPDRKRHIEEHWFQVGGPVPTALVTARRLGGHAAAFLGKWGDDHHGDLIEADLDREGIDCSASIREPGARTGFAHIWAEPNGRRTIAYSRGEFDPPGPTDLPGDILNASSILHLDGWAGELALHAAQLQREQGGRIVLDAGSLKPGMEALFPLIDLLIASRQFMEDLDADSAELLAPQGEVIQTLGEDGALWRGRRFPAPAVEAVDTNGAGDVFSGALLHALLEDWPMERCIAFANAAAAYKCARAGNRDALPVQSSVNHQQ